MFNKGLELDVKDIINFALLNNIKICTAESCTAGMISSALTSIRGSSKAFEYGLNVYSNESKSKLLGIDSDLIKKYGPASYEVCKEMALKCFDYFDDQDQNVMSVSITGYADYYKGKKTLSNVFIGTALRCKGEDIKIEIINKEYNYGRTRNRKLIVKFVLQRLKQLLSF